MPEGHSQYLLNSFHNTGDELITRSLMKILNFNKAIPNKDRGPGQSYIGTTNIELVERRLSLAVTFSWKNKNLN